MKKTIVISLVLMIATGALFAQKMDRNAMPPNAPAAYERMNSMQRFMQDLNLTEAQAEKFAQARTAFERQKNTISADLKNLRLDLLEAMKSENFRRAKEINSQISTKELELANAKIDLFANQIKELNAEQKTIMMKRLPMMMGRPAMMDNMHQRHQMMQKPGSGEKNPGHRDRQRLQECEDCNDCDGEHENHNKK